MKIIAILLAAYTLVMLLIHFSTWKILRDWNQHPDSWISRRFPPRRALRTEGVFWLLALASWFLWRPLAWKVVIVVFAAIHLGIWGAGEFRRDRESSSAFDAAPGVQRAIVAFDLVEAFVLVAVGIVAVLYLAHPA